MKKKLIAMAMAAALCLPFTGCGNNSSTTTATTETQEYFADEDFIKDLQKGLEARWSINRDNTLTMTDDELKILYEDSIKAELDCIEKYQAEKFENTKLQEAAIQYINILKDSQDTLTYMNADTLKFSEDWELLYNKRSQMISSFYTNFGLTVSEEYESVLNEFITTSKVVTEKESKEKTIDDWVKSISFEVAEDNGVWKTYQAIVENTTGFDFQNISLSINLIDADGVVIETTYSSLDNIAAGTKVKFEFMTDSEFASTDVTATYFLK